MLKAMLRAAAAAVLLALLAAAAAWYYRVALLELAAARWAAAAGASLSPGSITRVTLSEIRLASFRTEMEGFSLSVSSASLGISWKDLLAGRHWLDAEVHAPAISWSAGGTSSGAVFYLPPLYPLKSLSVTGASAGASGGRQVLGSFKAEAGPDGISFSGARFDVSGTPLSADGSCSGAGCSFSGHAGPSAALPGRAGLRVLVHPSSATFSALLPGEGLSVRGSADAEARWSLRLSLSGKGSFPWLSGQCAGDGKGYSPQRMKGRLSCLLRAAGIPVEASLKAEKGELAFSAGASSAAVAASLSGVYSLSSGRGEASLVSSGDLALPGEGMLKGLSLRVSATGDGGRVSASGSVSAVSAEAYGFSAEGLALEASGGSGEAAVFGGEFRLGRLKAGAAEFSPVTLRASGRPEEHLLELRAEAPAGDIRLSASGSLAGAWEGEVSELSGFGLRLTRPFPARISSGGGAFSGLSLAYGAGRLEASAEYAGGRLAGLEAEVRGFDIAAASAAFSQAAALAGKLDASLRLAGAYDSPEGEISVRSDGIVAGGVRLGKLRASAVLSAGRLESREAWLETPGGRLESSFSAEISPGRFPGDYYFTVVSSDTDVGFLSAFMPGTELRTVLLNADIRVSRRDGALDVDGGASLSAAGLVFKGAGLKFSPVNLDLRRSADGAGVAFSGFAGAGAGWLEAGGALSAAGPALRLKAARVAFDSPYGLRGAASRADMRVSGSWEFPFYAGNFELSELRFDQERWDKSPSSDGRPSAYGLDLSFSVPRNAWYRSEAGSIEGRGEIAVKKQGLGDAAVIGQVESVRGTYAYLGKPFEVKAAKVNFAGRTPPDPGIYLLAAYEDRVNSIKVYFEAEGTMRYPKSRLYSEPPMEQRDIMSVMLTGRPLYALYSNGADSGQQGSSTVAAEQALAGYLSGRAGLLVRDKLGLDMLNIRMTEERRADVTVGRYLTDDLFVGYGQTLGPRGEKRVNAEYSLTKHLSLEGKTSSEGRYSTDLLFKFGVR